MKRSSKRKASSSVSSEAIITVENPPQQLLDGSPAQLDLNSSANNALGSSYPKNSIAGCRGCLRRARGYKRCLRSLKCECLLEETESSSSSTEAVDVGVSSIQLQNASTTKSDAGVPSTASSDLGVPSLPVPVASTTKRRSKRKARSSVSSESITAENPPQRLLDGSPAQLDLNSYTNNALGSSSPNNSISGCRGCLRRARGLERCLRSLKCECLLEESESSSQSTASADLGVPSLPVPVASTTKSDMVVPSAASADLGVPSLPVPVASTTKSGMVVPSAASADLRVPSLPVPVASTTKSGTGVPSAASINLRVPVLPSVASPAFINVKLPTFPILSALTTSVRVPSLLKSSNMQSSASTITVPRPALINNDPFRSMRLDIDRMSYEELLALQERIGYVSTGLSGNELMKARKITTYCVRRRKTTNDEEVDSKCSICQEEFLNRDMLGNLKCKHTYHLICIEQWLRQRNWCPTCKTDARGCL